MWTDDASLVPNWAATFRLLTMPTLDLEFTLFQASYFLYQQECDTFRSLVPNTKAKTKNEWSKISISLLDMMLMHMDHIS
jgi:hypothetical protein